MEVSGLELTNQSDDFEFFKGATVSASEIDSRMDRTGVAGIAKDGGTMEHIYLDDLYIHNVDGNIEDKHMNNGGIQMNVLPPAEEASTGIARYHDVKITNCYVKDVSRAGICVGYTYNGSRFGGKEISDETAKEYGHTDILIEGNYVQNAGNDGIVAMYAYRPLIQRNVADRAGADLESRKSTASSGSRFAPQSGRGNAKTPYSSTMKRLIRWRVRTGRHGTLILQTEPFTGIITATITGADA